MSNICEQRAAYKEFKEAVIKAAIFDNPLMTNDKKSMVNIPEYEEDWLYAKKAYTGKELTSLLYKLEQDVNRAYLTAKGYDVEDLPWVWSVVVDIEAFYNLAKAVIHAAATTVIVQWDYETNMIRVHKS